MINARFLQIQKIIIQIKILEKNHRMISNHPVIEQITPIYHNL